MGLLSDVSLPPAERNTSSLYSLFRRGDLAEPPPKPFRNLPQAPGFKVVEKPSVADVDAYCRAKGIRPDESFRPVTLNGCLLDYDREIVLPEERAIGKAQYDALFQHENNGHGYGLTHGSGGRGWQWSPEFFRKNPDVPRVDWVP